MQIVGTATVQDVREQLRAWPLKATSAGRSWAGVHIDEFGEIILQDHFAPPRDHANIAVCLGTSPLITQKRGGKAFASPSRIGDFSINPAGYESFLVRNGPAACQHAASPRKAGRTRKRTTPGRHGPLSVGQRVPPARSGSRAHRRDLQPGAEPFAPSGTGPADRVARAQVDVMASLLETTANSGGASGLVGRRGRRGYHYSPDGFGLNTASI